jgi:hypothetical protein
VQLVPVKDVAWHAGNAWWNLHSIGIEHEGWAGRGRYTVAEYRASAQLAAYLAHRWGIPIDRQHIIGHAEVPNPSRPGHFGGISGHTDPGRYWNWRGYMWLVRFYSAHPVLPAFVKRMTLHDSPAPAPARNVARVTTSTVDRGAVVRGKTRWWSGIDASRRWRRHIYKTDFLVDGRTLYTDHTWPYSFHRSVGWDSRTVANGRHMLTVLAYGTHRYRVRKRIPVRVVNPPLRADVSGVVAGSAVQGRVELNVQPSEATERVVLYADGKAIWETLGVREGGHRLVVYVRGLHGRRAALAMPVVVANSATFPPALAENWFTHGVTPES